MPIVGKRQTGARAEILGDPHRRIWEQQDESLEAFEKRVEEEANAFAPNEWGLTRDNSFSQVVSGAACIATRRIASQYEHNHAPKQFHINTLNFNKNIVISASQN